MESIHPELRQRELDGAHGSPLLAAVNLTLELSANRPDDGPEVRLGWPLEVAVMRSIEVIAEPLAPHVVEELVRGIARKRGLLLGGQEVI